MTPLIIVDAANVVGSIPDGWWRDRRGATTRLRDRLASLEDRGLPQGPLWARGGPLRVVMVVEGRARGIDSSDTVTVTDAPGSGDDTIAAMVGDEAPQRHCLVITSDRGLRERVVTAGGEVVGASAVRRMSDHNDGDGMA